MRKDIEDYIRQQGWIFAGTSHPDKRRVWVIVKDDKIVKQAYEEDLVELASNIVEHN